MILGELHSGSRTAGNEQQLRSFLRKPSVAILDVTAVTARRYAEKGRPIPRNYV